MERSQCPTNTPIRGGARFSPSAPGTPYPTGSSRVQHLQWATYVISRPLVIQQLALFGPIRGHLADGAPGSIIPARLLVTEGAINIEDFGRF
jgi:hypothetical protein